MIYDGTHTYQWDPDGHLILVDGGSTASYVYDAQGRREAKVMGAVRTLYFYDLAGRVEAEGQGSTWTWTAGYVYLDGQMVAEYQGGTGGATYFASPDHLGSTRVMTGMNSAVTDSMDYMPFGEQIAGANGTTHKFTGLERDAESGLDHTPNRQLASSYGRWLSPDPAGTKAVTLTDPQTWNMYAYARNNPTTLTDPSGLVAGPGCSAQNRQNCHADPHPFAAAAKYYGAAAKGFLKAVVGAAIGAALMTNPIGATVVAAGIPAGIKQAAQTVNAAAHGNPEAIGQVIGMASMAAAGAAMGGGGGATSSESLSTFRFTAAGETFTHYGYAADASQFAGGLRAGGFATTESGLTGAEAQSGLALSKSVAPDAAYTVSPDEGTPININPVTQPQFGQPGGLPEVQFPMGTGPGTVSGPTPIDP